MLYPKVIELCDINQNKANVSSRNDFIEKSILFYVGYLNGNQSEFLNNAIENTLNSQLNFLEDKIKIVLFKQSVEINMLNNIIATISKLDQETIDILRRKSIQEVKETSGKITLDDIVKNSDIT